MKLPAPLLPAQPSSVDARNPWVGLSSFTEDQTGYFHGRDDEKDELLRLVRREPLTVLFGLSGLGKSSLLQAGVFPALRSEGWLPVSIRLDHAPEAAHPIAQVKAAIVRAVEGSGLSFLRQPSADESLWEFFHSRDAGVSDAAGRPMVLLLAFDQFEEIFTLGRTSDTTGARRDDLLAELADLVGNRVPEPLRERIELDDALIENLDFDRSGYRVLISLREDYLAELESLRSKIPLIFQNRMRLKPMDGRQAMQAVLGPGADLVGTEVAEQIVRFVSHSRPDDAEDEKSEAQPLENLEVEPSLLSLFCRELNSRRIAKNLPEITRDLLASSSSRILQDFYEQCFEGQPQAAKEFIEDDLLTDSGFRENMALPSARKRLKARGISSPDALIETLVLRRLLHIEERQDLQRIELTHDVLTDVVMKSRIERHKRDEEEEARRKEAERAASVTAAREREMVALRQLRNTRRRSGFFALLSLLAIAGFTVALFSYKKAVQQGEELERQKLRETQLAADARRDASLSDMITASTVTRGSLARAGNIVALLSRAVDRDLANRNAFVSLLDILGSSSWPIPSMPTITLPDAPGGAFFSPDGRKIASFYGNTAGIWDAASGEGIASSTFPSRVVGSRFTPDGQSLVAVLEDGTVALRGAAGTSQPPDVKLCEGISSVKFSHDLRFLAVSAGDEIRLLEIATGHRSVIKAGGQALSLRFSPDGTRIAAGIQVPSRGMLTCVWETKNGRPVEALTAPCALEPRFLAFSPHGTSLAASSKEFIFLRQENGNRSAIKLLADASCVEFSPDGALIATGSRNGEVIIARNPELRPPVAPGGSGECPLMDEFARVNWSSTIVSIDFSPDAMRALIAVGDGTVWLVDVAELRPPDKNIGIYGSRVGRISGWIKSQPIRQNGEIVAAKFSPDGRQVLVASKNNTIRSWEVLPNQILPTPLPAHAPVSSIAVAGAGVGNFIAAVLDDGSCVLWQMRGGLYSPTELPPPPSPFVNVGFDQAGTRLWTVSEDGSVSLWNADSASGISKLPLPASDRPAGTALLCPSHIAIAPTSQGDFLLVARGSEIQVLPLSGDPGAAPLMFSSPQAAEGFVSVEISPDGSQLAASSDRQVFLWDLRSPGAPARTLELNAPASILKFAPGSRALAVAVGRRVLFFAPDSARPSSSFPHADDVVWMGFLPDSTLVTCSGKEVWQWRGGIPLGDALPHSAPISSAAISPDGEFLITSCEDETVRVWELDSSLLVFDRSFPGVGALPAGFNAAASAFFTTSRGCVFAWDFPGHVRKVPKPLPALGFAISGTEFSGNRVRTTFSDVNKQLESASSAILNGPGSHPWTRWIASIREKNRPISPSSQVTRDDLAEMLIASGTRENLLSALLLSPCNPRALKKLSASLQEKSPGDPRAVFFKELAKKFEGQP